MNENPASGVPFPLGPCSDPAKCADPACQAQIAAAHSIKHEQAFDQLIANYYTPLGTTPPKPLEKTAAEIKAMLNGVNCATNVIDFDLAEADTTTHQNMSLKVSPHYPPAPGELAYSIALFNGILLKSPTNFEFSRAIGHVSGKATMAIKAVNGQHTVYMGDLSDVFP